MITIEQLLESVDLDFEPRWVTKDDEGDIRIWEKDPVFTEGKFINHWAGSGKYHTIEKLHLVEFSDKPWTECIYEVPRKTTGKIEKLDIIKDTRNVINKDGIVHTVANFTTVEKINELVNYVNALIESNNIHEKQIDELQMKLEPEKCAVNELKGAKNE